MARLLTLVWLSWQLLLTAAAPSLAAVTWPLRSESVLPENDPFYTEPPGLRSIKAGTILRYRPVPNPITLDNKNAIFPKHAWQILYRTQNSIGKPSATVTTLFAPRGAGKGHLFTLNYFSDSAYSGCNPSMALQVGTLKDNEFIQAQSAIMVYGLSLGWFVNVPDDGGVQGAFGSGLQAAYATLDSIRAVKNFANISGMNPDPMVGMYGYSGGGLSAVWTTEMQPIYAPDVKIVGAAVGGLVPNVTATIELFNKHPRASFIPSSILGISHDYPNLTNWLNHELVPEYEAEFRKAEKTCFDGNDIYKNKDIGKYLKRGLTSLYEPMPLSVLEMAGTMGQRGPPQVPWYVYETVLDDISPVALTDKLIAKHCKAGARIQYERNSIYNLTHAEECVWGLPGAITFLIDRFNGKPAAPGCNMTVLSLESVRGLSQGRLFKGLFENAKAWAGQPIRMALEGVVGSAAERK